MTLYRLMGIKESAINTDVNGADMSEWWTVKGIYFDVR